MSRTYALIAGLAALACATTVSAQPPASRAAGPLTGAHLTQITLTVRDVDRAVAFYSGTLGLKELFRGGGAAFLDAGGARLRLEKSQTPAASGSVELYFDDPGLSRAGPLAARGVKFIGPPETVQRLATADLQLLEFTDPDGNALALMGEVARPR